MAPVHDRMPVIVSAEGCQRWFASPADEVADLICPYADNRLQAWTVERRVSRTCEEGEGLIAPVELDPVITQAKTIPTIG